MTGRLSVLLGALLVLAIGASGARAQDDRPSATADPDLVRQANAPISSILQLRLLDTYLPELWDVHGQTNTLTVSVTMPFPDFACCPSPSFHS